MKTVDHIKNEFSGVFGLLDIRFMNSYIKEWARRKKIVLDYRRNIIQCYKKIDNQQTACYNSVKSSLAQRPLRANSSYNVSTQLTQIQLQCHW